MTGFKWNAEAIEEMGRLFKEGASHRHIAGELSRAFNAIISRNAVIGKCNRLGLEPRGRTPVRHSKPERRQSAPRVARAPSRSFPRPAKTGHPWSGGEPKAGSIADLPAEVSDHSIALIETTNANCKWPLGEPTFDMLVCGAAAVDGHPYCARHNAIAYTPYTLRPRRRVTA